LTSGLLLTRRGLLQRASAAAVLACPSLCLRAQGWGGRDPFTLGVASGCPQPDGVVLWTRLAPDPLAGGGVGEAPVEVEWELADDERFTRIVARGSVIALAQDAHSVHVELKGLEPSRTYWYRFTARGERSGVGRTRTAPPMDAATPVRFAFASCQHYEQGFFSAYRDMAAQPLDLVVHLGDYVYDTSWGSRRVRQHQGAIPTQLAEFRDRYALYKSDRDLQAAHAAFPWLVTWDDHEVDNDWNPETIAASTVASAFTCFFDHAPYLRNATAPNRIWRSARWGKTVEVFVLDCRSERKPSTRNGANATYISAEQIAWLE